MVTHTFREATQAVLSHVGTVYCFFLSDFVDM